MSNLEDFYTRSLAAVFHDPPWKAWVVTNMLEAAKESWDRRSTLDILRDSVERKLGIQGMIRLPDTSQYKSHELHGLLLLEAVKAYAKKQGLDEVVSILSGAEDALTRGYARPCDHLASYIDRVMTYNVEAALDTIHGKDPSRYAASDAKYTNPFNPRKRLEQRLGRLQVSKVADYIDVVVRSIIGLAEKLIKDGGLEPGAALLHSSLLVLEEAWWSVIGGYMLPLADTRSPHHTVFDHLYATAAACGLVSKNGEPTGRVVIVDLAGVQAWISETRRLRDLWASSWLASMLAWRSVEHLVERLGPGVMVSPTTRLNPFYLSWLAGKAGISNIESKCMNNRGKDKWLEMLCKSLKIVMPRGWPLDPIMPTRIYLIIPPGIEDVESNVEEAYRRTWMSILKGVRYYLEVYYKHVSKLEEAPKDVDRHVWDYLQGIARELQANKLNLEVEPPLPLRLVDVSVKVLTQTQEYSRYNRILLKELLDKLREQRDIDAEEANVIVDSLRSIGGRWNEKLVGLYPYLMLVEIPKKEAKSRIKLTRRSGRHALEHSRQLYTVYKRLGRTDWKPTCMICGRMPAVIVGGVIKKISGGENETEREEFNDLENLLQEIRDERLCIYCLSKRLLRRLLIDKGFDERLVHITLNESAHSALVSGSTDNYTAVTQMNITTIYNILVDKLSKLEGNRKSIIENLLPVLASAQAGALPATIPLTIFFDKSQLVRRGRISLEAHVGKLLDNIKNIYKGEDAIELIANVLESTFIEALNDEAFRRTLLTDDRFKGNRILTDIAKAINSMQEFKRYSRMYGVLVADGDFMGSGILQGRLRITGECSERDDIEEYYDALLDNVEFRDTMFKAKVRAATIAYVKALNAAIRRVLEDTGVLESEEWSDIVIPPSLSYHYTVSRALALSSIKDRALVENLGGFLIYAGGDDLLAIIPPMRVSDDGRIEASGINLLYKSRLNYWGLVSIDQVFDVIDGFHKVDMKDGGTLIIAPAIQTYGRSAILYLAHVKTPMWHVISTAHRLMDEVKDAYSVKRVDGRVVGRKDVGIVYNERGTYGIIPLTDKIGLSVARLARTVEKIFLKMEKGEKDAPSTSSLYRATDRREAVVLAELAKVDVDAAIKYIDSLMEPRGRVEGWSIVNVFGEEPLEKSMKVFNELGEELRLPSRGVPEGTPAVIEVLEAVKALRSGVRRSA
ncbi:MAG: type III-B CRISPR-associated protein Cas10/Cmr2 [Desulfurococcales archaeon]|nr:type III-B CRISPR-associated protein Cas10/Cmr2 [Desulfurococcales archaeon]